MEEQKTRDSQSNLKRLFYDFSPFIALFLIYSALNSVVEGTTKVYVVEIYDAELLLFGWLFEGQIPSFWFREHQSNIITVIAAILYSLHFIIPLIAAFLIGYKTKDQDTFLRLKFSFLITTALALFTFILFPVAPPWYVASNGFVQPSTHQRVAESAAGLLAVDQLFGIDLFGSFYGSYNATPYAAVPSLHSAFSLLSAIMLVAAYKNRSKIAYLAYLYPLSIWFSAVYLMHHYILDIIIAVIYVLTTDLIVTRMIIPAIKEDKLTYESLKAIFS